MADDSNDTERPDEGQRTLDAILENLETRRGTIADRLAHHASRLSEYCQAAREAEGATLDSRTFVTPFEALALAGTSASYDMTRDAAALRELSELIVMVRAETDGAP